MTEKGGSSQQVRENARNAATYDFTNPDSPLSDMVLLVGGQRLYVNKAYLALHSPVFRTMFFADFNEKSKGEVALEEVEAGEFTELLHVIYPSLKPVSEGNAESLLKLADRFQMQRVVDLCEHLLFAEQAKQIPLARKFLLAEEYRLPRLQEWCMGQLRSLADVQALEKTEEYRHLSDKGKVAVLEKAAEFCGNSHCHNCGNYSLYDCYYDSDTRCRCGVISSGYLSVGDLMQMDVYKELDDGGKLALLMEALHF